MKRIASDPIALDPGTVNTAGTSVAAPKRGALTRSLGRLAPVLGGLLILAVPPSLAQPPNAMPPQSPRDSAAIDVTGQWVAIINEDWRWRMRTPPKGDYESVLTLNAEGRAVADAWDPAEDGSCKAYGAGGLLRMPTRLRISWEDDTTLRLQTDAGRQVRTFHFAGPHAAPMPPGEPSLQGVSVAQWHRPMRRPGAMGFSRGSGSGPDIAGGSLEITTTNLSEAWLRRNGVPYSDQTVLTEHFDRFTAPNGDEWLVVTTIVDDPVYHSGRFITSSHFKREERGGNWNPTSCRSD